METLSAFKMEQLEPRLEFRPLLSFWSALWDGICWLGESAWDIVQAYFEKAGPTLQFNDQSHLVNFNVSAPGFFKELITRWTATWNEYWGVD